MNPLNPKIGVPSITSTSVVDGLATTAGALPIMSFQDVSKRNIVYTQWLAFIKRRQSSSAHESDRLHALAMIADLNAWDAWIEGCNYRIQQEQTERTENEGSFLAPLPPFPPVKIPIP